MDSALTFKSSRPFKWLQRWTQHLFLRILLDADMKIMKLHYSCKALRFLTIACISGRIYDQLVAPFMDFFYFFFLSVFLKLL